jgi:seryl-tRNA synthetase
MVVARTLTLDEPVPGELVAEVTEKLAYASETLRSVRLTDDRAGVELIVDDAAQLEAASKRVLEIVNGLVRGFREIPKEVLWRHPATPRYQAPIWDDLIAQGTLTSAGPGCVALFGDSVELFAALDRMFTAIGHDRFGAVDHQYPVLIAKDTMERCDYFASFPHHITFAPHLRESVENITEVANASKEARATVIQGALSPPGHILSPAVCFHTYAWLADKPLTQQVVITAVNRCFRYEATNFATMERLWDFSMREIVFVGDPAWIEQRRRETMTAVQGIVERLGLDAWIETANDPFFVTRFAAKRYHQLLTQAKYELRLALPYAGTSLAAASFNIHSDFFGRAYSVARGDGFASTGCMAFGLERWVWALYAQHGPRIADWPAATKRTLGL